MKKIFALLFFLILLVFITGCGSSGGGPVTASSGFELILLASTDLIEAGETVKLTISLRSAEGIFLQSQPIELSVINEDVNTPPIGVINFPNWETDSTSITGVRGVPVFTSTGIGNAIILATYIDGAGNTLDTTTVEILMVEALHNFINFWVTPSDIAVEEQASIYCILAQGSQEAPIRTAGKEIYFESVNNATLAPFGVISPAYFATTNADPEDGDGLDGSYFFVAHQPGIARVRVIYKNSLGLIASIDSVVVRIGQDQ